MKQGEDRSFGSSFERAFGEVLGGGCAVLVFYGVVVVVIYYLWKELTK